MLLWGIICIFAQALKHYFLIFYDVIKTRKDSKIYIDLEIIHFTDNVWFFDKLLQIFNFRETFAMTV